MEPCRAGGAFETPEWQTFWKAWARDGNLGVMSPPDIWLRSEEGRGPEPGHPVCGLAEHRPGNLVRNVADK